MNKAKSVLYALLAAAFYAINVPLSKLLLSHVGPTTMASLLYLGAGIGIGLMSLFRHQRGEKLAKKDMPFVIGMIVLDIAAPIFLMLGISYGSSSNASLLGNFEIVATTLIALFIFKETVTKRLWGAIGLITISSILLSFEGAESFRFSLGSLFVLLAAVCWGLENNCTSSISDKDTRQIVIIKGLGSGAASFVISLAVGEKLCSVTDMIIIMVLGFFAIGLGVYLYVIAQSVIGAARTSSYYAVSPFIGVLLSLVIFREIPGMLFWAALVIMAIGVYLNVMDVKKQSC